MDFYTDVSEKQGKIHVRGYKNDRRVQRIADYHPYIYLKSNQEAESRFKTLEGQKVTKLSFKTIKEATGFIFNNKKAINPEPIWGIDFQTAAIHDLYPGDIDFDFNKIALDYIDIETDSHGGFANIEQANKEVTAICLRKSGKSLLFGMKPYQVQNDNEKFIFCSDEIQLLKKYLDYWNDDEWQPDIISGWNIEGFDLPYLVGRITRVLSKDYAERLSPWGILESKTILTFGKEQQLYFPVGIQVLDYMRVYKKFSQKKLESYSLDFVSQTELGEGKLDYSQYQSLDDLYQNDPQTFFAYNIKDCERVEALENKLGMIKQLATIAYLTKSNYNDVFGTIRIWDSFIYGYLNKQNIVVPQTTGGDNKDFMGGFVKEVKPGLYDWVISFDFTSLYPSLIMAYNISPETFAGRLKHIDHQSILDGALNVASTRLKDENCAIAGNMCLYHREKQGFLPALMQSLFDERVKYKKEMLKGKQLLEDIENELKNRNL